MAILCLTGKLDSAYLTFLIVTNRAVLLIFFIELMTLHMNFSMRLIVMVQINISLKQKYSYKAGWPRHRENRENREFGLTFYRQGKHREFCFDTGKIFETQGKYFSVTQGKI